MSEPDDRPPLPYVHIADAAVYHPERPAVAAVHSKGMWWLPGGRVEESETFRQAAVREVLEETGLVVETMGVLGITERFHRGRHEVFMTFAAHVLDGELQTPEDDPKVAAAKWVDLGQVYEQLEHFGVLRAVVNSPLRTVPHLVE